jgi:PTS system fructose-specific IIC component
VNVSSLITTDLVRLDVSLGATKEEVIRALAGILGEAGRTHDVDRVVADALAREAASPTGLPGGIALPHCRTAGVSEPTLAFARLSPPVDFGAKDGPADLAFLITAPAGGDSTYLEILTRLTRALVKTSFVDTLRGAGSPGRVVELIRGALGESPATV